MKMFPHALFPFFPLHQDHVAPLTSAKGASAVAPAKQARATGTRPVKIDVEKAVAVMLATKDIKNDTARQKCRFEIIRAVPPQSIDWDTVDWVQMWPFQTVRR